MHKITVGIYSDTPYIHILLAEKYNTVLNPDNSNSEIKIYETQKEIKIVWNDNSVVQSKPISAVLLIELIEKIQKEILSVIIDDGIELNMFDKIVKSDNEQVKLTSMEADLLFYLMTSHKQVTKEDLLSEIWGYSNASHTKTIENHIYKLRNKAPFLKKILSTVLENEIN